MNINQITSALNRVENGLTKYIFIMDKFHKVDVSSDIEFQRAYNGFYRVRQRSQDFYTEYFKYMEEKKALNPSFEDVLLHIYRTLHRLEASFSSKLVATINPELPVWDTFVLNNLGIKKPAYYGKERIDETIEAYNRICQWYRDFISTQEAKDIIDKFDERFPNTDLTDVKKIDLVLWQTR